MAAQPHAAHEVHLDEPLPVLVGNGLERLGLEDAQIVDQDVEVGVTGDGLVHARSRAEVACQAHEIGPGAGQPAQCFLHPRLRAAVHDHRRTLTGQRLGDGEADPGGRARDQRASPAKL